MSTTTDNARLRRLDSLFAEKVLGCNVLWSPDDTEPRCGCHGNWPHCNTEKLGDGYVLDPYTRSLDAAWEGVAKLGLASLIRRWADGHVVVQIDTDDKLVGHSHESTDPYPAEALVLACLRAVGCSQEELA